MKTIIHVNKHNIKHNSRHGKKDLKVISVKTYKNTTYCDEATIHGPSKLVYRPEKPLSCGATVWLETQSDVDTR